MAFGHTRHDVLSVETPDPTQTYAPVSYERIIKLVERRLAEHSVQIIGESWGLKSGGNKLFGILNLDLQGTMGEISSHYMLGIRASHDKSTSVHILAGENVGICSNGQWWAEFHMSRRHVGMANAVLPVLIAKLIDNALNARGTQAQTWDRLREINLNPGVTLGVRIPEIETEKIHWPAVPVEMPGKTAARQILLTARAMGILNAQQEKQVAEEFHKPRFEEFRGLNAFNLLQAVTTCAQHEKGWDEAQSFAAPVKLTDLIFKLIVR